MKHNGRLLLIRQFTPVTATGQLPLTLPATLPAGTYLLRTTAPYPPPLHTRLVLVR